MTMPRNLLAMLVCVTAACSGGAGDLPGTDGGASSSSSSSSGSSSGSSGGGGQIRASDFDRTCTGDGDCVAVFEGDICSPCGCPNAAIARTDREKYDAARAAAACPKPDVQCDVCAAPVVTCAGGTCALPR